MHLGNVLSTKSEDLLKKILFSSSASVQDKVHILNNFSQHTCVVCVFFSICLCHAEFQVNCVLQSSSDEVLIPLSNNSTERLANIICE